MSWSNWGTKDMGKHVIWTYIPLVKSDSSFDVHQNEIVYVYFVQVKSNAIFRIPNAPQA